MIYQSKILFNPKETPVEFRFGGVTHIMEPKEKRNFDGIVAKHALVTTNTGLVEYTQEFENEVGKSTVRYKDMPWKELLKIASKEGVYSLGITREKIIEALDGKNK